MSAAVKPVLICYGNCQASAIAWLFRSDPTIDAAFDVHYLANFDSRIPGTSVLAAETVASAAIFFEQFGRVTFPYEAELPETCVRVTFPSIDLNLLWPLHVKRNPLNDPPTPEHLWGHFPNGDRVINDAVMRGGSADEIVASYPAASAAALPNLERFEKIEWARLRARDAKCDVKMADFVSREFTRQRLLWCINHPTLSTLRELGLRLIGAAREKRAVISTDTLDETIASVPPQGPLGFLIVPIHPLISDRLGLEWIPNADETVYGLRDEPLTYSAYFRMMTKYAIAAREALRVGTAG